MIFSRRKQYMVTFDFGDFLFYAVRIKARNEKHVSQIIHQQYGDSAIIHWIDEE